METLSTMSGSKWYFWKCKYDNSPGYIMKKIAEIETFEDLEMLIEQQINFDEDQFALFREGFEPHYEDLQNKTAFTWINNNGDNKACLKYFYIFWKERFFSYPYINGIYCSPFKISTWTSKCEDEQKFRDKLASHHFRAHIYDISAKNYEERLTRRWTISFFDNEEFVLQKRSRFPGGKITRLYSTDIPEKLIKVIYEQFHFTAFQKGIILTPNIIDERDWRRQCKENRFVYCSVNATLKEANQILPKFALSLSYDIYPKIPTIFVAFAYYTDGYLELGIYLSGRIQRDLSINRIEGSAYDLSSHVAYKIKEIVTSILPLDQTIYVHIRNFVPSERINFNDKFYEFPDRERNIYSTI